MAEFRLVLDQPTITTLLRSPTGPVWAEILRRAREVERYAKASGTQSGRPGQRGRQKWSYTPGRVPRDTSQLANSIRHNLVVEGTEIVGIVSANTRYAKFVHDGTRYLEKRPFLKDALDIVMKQK